MYDSIELLKGKTLVQINRSSGNDALEFVTNDGERYRMYHEEDCCESVTIEDIVGDLDDLLNSPILQADEETSETRPSDLPAPDYEPESQTWTFYKLATIKGSVTIRWFGESNGYYSESVEFEKVKP